MNALVWVVGILAGLGGFGTLCWFAGKAAKRFFDRLTDSIVAEKLAKAEAIEAHETNERQVNDAAILKSVNDVVDGLSSADVAERVQSDWKSPV